MRTRAATERWWLAVGTVLVVMALSGLAVGLVDDRSAERDLALVLDRARDEARRTAALLRLVDLAAGERDASLLSLLARLADEVPAPSPSPPVANRVAAWASALAREQPLRGRQLLAAAALLEWVGDAERARGFVREWRSRSAVLHRVVADLEAAGAGPLDDPSLLRTIDRLVTVALAQGQDLAADPVATGALDRVRSRVDTVLAGPATAARAILPLAGHPLIVTGLDPTARQALRRLAPGSGLGPGGLLVLVAVILLPASLLVFALVRLHRGPAPIDPGAETLQGVEPIDLDTQAQTLTDGATTGGGGLADSDSRDVTGSGFEPVSGDRGGRPGSRD